MPSTKEYSKEYYNNRKEFGVLYKLKPIPRSYLLRCLQLLLIDGTINQYDFSSGLDTEIVQKADELVSLIQAKKSPQKD